MSYSVFDTTYIRNNDDTLRWASVAVASVLVVLCLVWSVMIWSKVRADVQSRKTETANATSVMSEGNTTLQMMIIAFFWIVTLVSTWLSWYVAALHMRNKNLIALDVLNVLIFIMLGMSAYFYYKNNPSKNLASMFISGSLVLEFIALLVLVISSTTAGSDGSLTQSALYIPLMVTTISMMR